MPDESLAIFGDPVIPDNFLYGKTASPNKTKELKVRLPVSVHMRLHGLKILGDKSISRTVEEALDAYFEKHNLNSPRERPASEAAPATAPEAPS